MLKNLRIGRLSACSQFFYCLLAGWRRNRSEFAAKQSVFWLKNSVSAVKNGKNRHKNKAEKARLRVEKRAFIGKSVKQTRPRLFNNY